MKILVKVSYLHSIFAQIFHSIQRCFTMILILWLRPLTVSFLYEDEPPLSGQLLGKHTGQGLPHLGFPVSIVNLFGMQIFCHHHHLLGTHFTDPWRHGRLSQPASIEARTHQLTHKSKTRY